MEERTERRIKVLLKKHKKLLTSYRDVIDFKEPIIFLIRRSQKVEFYENAIKNKFEFTDAEGETRNIILDPSFLLTFDYGKKRFKGYVCHEDHKTPLPENPFITAQQFDMAIDKTLNDVKEWKAKELKAKGEMWKAILIGIAVLGLVYILYKMLIKNEPPSNPEIQVIREVTTQAVQNVTPAILG